MEGFELMSVEPLKGMKILDCTQFMAGPYCTLILADMGADVVKIERPGRGDETRHQAPNINGVAAPFLMINRNKRSLALDLKRTEGQETFRRLVPYFDVVVENFRPAVMERMNLNYANLVDIHASLIYCSISGFGKTGPYKHRGGFDLVAQGMSGIMSFTGIPGYPPVKVGVPITDLGAGMYAANGIMAAYIHKLKTGQGQHIDTSLMEAGVALTPWESGVLWATGESPGPLGSAHRMSAPYQVLQCKDKAITMGAANQANWERLCAVIDREDLIQDPRFINDPLRRENYQELAQVLESILCEKPAAYWLDELEKAQVPSGPLYNMEEVYADPQIKARNMVVRLNHPTAGSINSIGIPVKFSETPGTIRTPAPLLGEHSKQILHENGFAEQEIADLIDNNVIETSDKN